MESLFSKATRSLRTKGLAQTFRLIVKNLLLLYSEWSENRFDRVRNVKTAGIIPTKSLGALTENKQFSEDYVPTPLSVIKRSIESLPYDLGDFTFIDIGSGKGRVLFKAAEYNFRKIIGIEFSEQLHNMCTENIKNLSLRRRRCFSIESVFQDILYYELPDENLVLFMFNPFGEKVFAQFVTKIRHHFLTSKKKICIIYYNPKHGYHLLQSDFLKDVPYKEPLVYLSIRPVWPVAMFETVAPCQVAALAFSSRTADHTAVSDHSATGHPERDWP